MVWRQKVVRESTGTDFSRRVYEDDEEDEDEMNAEDEAEAYEAPTAINEVEPHRRGRYDEL